MKNILVIIFSLFMIGVVAYVVSFVVSFGSLVTNALNISSSHWFGDPYTIYVSLILGVLSIISILTLLIIGFAIRREGVSI